MMGVVQAEPERRADAGRGFTVLDGAALIVGAAAASVHVRESLRDETLDGVSWSLLWITLAGVALTAAGPIVFLLRRFGRRPEGYPRVGDWLWLGLGLPWLLAAPLRPDALADIVLGAGVALASLSALVVVWNTWVAVPVEPGHKAAAKPLTYAWTDRLGLVLAVAWPLQCGFVLVVGAP